MLDIAFAVAVEKHARPCGTAVRASQGRASRRSCAAAAWAKSSSAASKRRRVGREQAEVGATTPARRPREPRSDRGTERGDRRESWPEPRHQDVDILRRSTSSTASTENRRETRKSAVAIRSKITRASRAAEVAIDKREPTIHRPASMDTQQHGLRRRRGARPDGPETGGGQHRHPEERIVRLPGLLGQAREFRPPAVRPRQARPRTTVFESMRHIAAK